MDNTYFPLLILFLLAGAFVGFMLVLSSILGPKVHNAVKDDPFECGTLGSGSPTSRLSVKFYLVAMIFILFDVEVVFMYPWAVNFREFIATGSGAFVFVSMMIFLAVFIYGLWWEVKSKALEWD